MRLLIKLFKTLAIHIILLSVITLQGCGTSSKEPIELSVMTYNVLCSMCTSEGYDPWNKRLLAFEDIFKRYDADLVGTQELFRASEVDKFLEMMPGFKAIYFHDDNPPYGLKDYPDAAVFYRTSRFELLDSGVIWLGDTPDEPWTGGWAATNVWRIVVWSKLLDKNTGREFYFAVTHFDNNYPNQEKSAPLVLSIMSKWADEGLPIIFIGDYNSKPETIAYKTLTNGVDNQGFHFNDSFDYALEKTRAKNNDNTADYDYKDRIDHIFTGSNTEFTALTWVWDMWVYGDKDRFPSDHWPVYAKLKF